MAEDIVTQRGPSGEGEAGRKCVKCRLPAEPGYVRCPDCRRRANEAARRLRDRRRGGPPVTPKQRRSAHVGAALELWEEGQGLEAIAAELGVPVKTARRVLEEGGVQRDIPVGDTGGRRFELAFDRTWRLTDDLLARLCARSRDGALREEIVSELGIPEEVLHHWVRRGIRGEERYRVLREASLAGRAARSQRQREHDFDQEFFECVDTEEKAYWLGMLAADGWVTRYRVNLRLAAKDRDHVRAFARAVGSDREPTRVLARGGHLCRGRVVGPSVGYNLSLNSAKMARDLGRLGIVPNKTFTVTAWRGPRHLLRHYWRGVIDGDGSLGVYGTPGHAPSPTVMLAGNWQMAEAFLAFVKGVVPTRARVRSCRNIATARFGGGRLVPQVVQTLYGGAAVALARKAARAGAILARWPPA